MTQIKKEAIVKNRTVGNLLDGLERITIARGRNRFVSHVLSQFGLKREPDESGTFLLE